MVSRAQRIETAKADFVDAALYEDEQDAALLPLSRGMVLGGLSRAFDLAEGRRPGHAQRVAYAGLALARELRMRPARLEEVYFACILHDAGMATSRGRTGTTSRARESAGEDLIAAHTRAGARLVRKLGLSAAVARAVAWHHTTPGDDPEGTTQGSDRGHLVARIVATADRVESIIDGEAPPLWLRRRGPSIVRQMGSSELDPKLAEAMASIMERDAFWLGLYDNEMGPSLLAEGFGGEVSGNDLTDMLAVLSDIVDERACREPGSGRKVADLARRMGQKAGLGERWLRQIEVAALLQDIGTLGVPVQYLSKPDILTVDEMTAMQLHPTLARDIVSELAGLGTAAWWIGCHHERIDGKGYPGMLEGDDVPVEAQIIGLAEAYVALRSERPYRLAMSRDAALDVLRGSAGTRFVPELAAVLEATTA